MARSMAAQAVFDFGAVAAEQAFGKRELGLRQAELELRNRRRP